MVHHGWQPFGLYKFINHIIIYTYILHNISARIIINCSNEYVIYICIRTIRVAVAVNVLRGLRGLRACKPESQRFGLTNK